MNTPLPEIWNKASTIERGAYILIIASYIVIFCVLLRPDISWVHPEIQRIDDFIIHIERPWYQLLFNWEGLEFAPRHTRPLSSIVQVIDSKMRAAASPYIYLYSQSWSVTWLLSLFFNPYIFYRFLRVTSFDRTLSMYGFALYLLSPTNLSSIVLFFRPAKVLAQLFLLVSLYIVVSQKESAPLRKNSLLALIVFLGLISDEAGWFAIPAALIFSYLYDKKNLLSTFTAMCCSTAAAFSVYFYVMPALSLRIWGAKAVLGDYFILNPLLKSDSFLSSVGSLLVESARAFVIHIKIFTCDLLSIYALNPQNSWQWKTIYLVATLFIVGWLLFSVTVRRRLMHDKYFIAATICYLIGLAYHSVLMTVVGNKIWGPYYYGAYITPFLILMLLRLSTHYGDVWEEEKIKKTFFAIAVALSITVTHTFLATNAAIKKYHFYPPGSTEYREMFLNETNRFIVAKVQVDQIHYIRSTIRLSGACIDDFPVELVWLATKFRLVKGYGFPPGDLTMKICR